MPSILVQPLVSPVGRALEVTVPGSKSITNRALICAALAGGTSTVSGALIAEDTLAMVDCIRLLGAGVTVNGPDLEVAGVDGQLRRGPLELDVRQSGTTSRFILPVLGLGKGEYRLDGDQAMRNRPLGDLIAALGTLGVAIGGDGLPLTVSSDGLSGGRVLLPGNVSSQFLSGLLLSAPYCREPLTVDVDGDLVSRPYVELTTEVMANFGVEVGQPADASYVVPRLGYRATELKVEPDASAASYFFALAALTGASVTIEGLGSQASQGDLAFVWALERMGASVEQDANSTTVSGTGHLTGIEIDMSQISDTAQTLAVVAVAAEGPTRITGIGFIRRKETDRIRAMVTELGRLGIRAENDPDGLTIYPGTPQAATIQTYEDHRMAMSFAALGTRFGGISIADPGCVAKTFPEFFSVLSALA